MPSPMTTNCHSYRAYSLVCLPMAQTVSEFWITHTYLQHRPGLLMEALVVHASTNAHVHSSAQQLTGYPVFQASLNLLASGHLSTPAAVRCMAEQVLPATWAQAPDHWPGYFDDLLSEKRLAAWREHAGSVLTQLERQEQRITTHRSCRQSLPMTRPVSKVCTV